MQLNSSQIIRLINSEIIKLADGVLNEIKAAQSISNDLTIMHVDTREKFTIAGLDKSSGNIDSITLINSAGEPISVKSADLKHYMLPKDASNDENDQIYGDKENEK